jgi:hypothetical protein
MVSNHLVKWISAATNHIGLSSWLSSVIRLEIRLMRNFIPRITTTKSKSA